MGCSESQVDESLKPQKLVPLIQKLKVGDIQYIDSDNNSINYRVLLIGTSESGKSTFCKQIQNLYGKNYTNQQLEDIKNEIKTSILNDTVTVLNAIKKRYSVTKLLNNNFGFADNKFYSSSTLTEELATAIYSVYNRGNIFKKTLEELMLTKLGQYSSYFIENCLKFAKADYKPTSSEILYHRINTYGVASHVVRINNQYNIEFVELGGLRSQRQHWYKYYKNVDYIIYFASLSSFDDISVLDKVESNVSDSLSLFSILSLKDLESIPVLLLLTKKDIFQTKFSDKVDLFKQSYPGYTESDTDVEAAINHVQQTYTRLISKSFIESKSINLINSNKFNIEFKAFISSIFPRLLAAGHNFSQIDTSDYHYSIPNRYKRESYRQEDDLDDFSDF